MGNFLDSLRKEVSATKADNAKLKEDLKYYHLVQRELNDLKSSQNQQKKNEQNSLKRQINDLKNRNTDLEKKLCEMSGKLQDFEHENGALKSQVSSLELDNDSHKKQHTKDLDELNRAKETAVTLFNGIQKKTSELTNTMLILERSDLEVKKISKDLSNLTEKLEVYKKGFDHFNVIKRVAEQVLEKDVAFCASSSLSDSSAHLDDEELVEMICSVIEDSVESKRLHFADVESCLQRMAELENHKNGYKTVFQEMTKKVKFQNDVLAGKTKEIKKWIDMEANLKAEIRTKSQVLHNQSERLNAMQKTIGVYEKQKSELQTEVSFLKQEVKDHQSKEVNYLITIAELRTESAVKDNTASDLKQKIVIFEKNEKDLSDLIIKLKRKVLYIIEGNKRDKLRFSEQQQRENLLKQELCILREDLNMRVSIVTSLQKSKQKLEIDLQKLRSNYKEIEEDFQKKEEEFVNSMQLQKKAVCNIESKVIKLFSAVMFCGVKFLALHRCQFIPNLRQ